MPSARSNALTLFRILAFFALLSPALIAAASVAYGVMHEKFLEFAVGFLYLVYMVLLSNYEFSSIAMRASLRAPHQSRLVPFALTVTVLSLGFLIAHVVFSADTFWDAQLPILICLSALSNLSLDYLRRLARTIVEHQLRGRSQSA